MAAYQTEYHTAPTPYSIQSWTPYSRQQHLQSRESWQVGDYRHPVDYETESWMLQDDRFTDEDEPVQQQRVLQTRQVAEGERHADSSLASWRIEKIGHRASIISDNRRSISRLNLSTRGSTADLKDFLQSRGKTKLNGLHLAAAKNDVNMITTIIKREGPNVHINQLDENECTPLMYAVISDSIAAIELLLHCGAKREEIDSNGRTAVHYAAFFGKAKALKFLIESAAHWMPRDVYGRTPLHWSSAHKDTKCLQVLIKHSSIVIGDISIRDYEGMSPLHCAAQYCRPKHVQVLYEANCDFSITDIEGKTALHWTVNNPDPSCIETLVACYPSLLNVKDMYGQTILHLVAQFGAINLIETLLSFEGIEIDAKDNNEQTPLHVAAMAGQPEPVQLLLLNNALDSCIDRSGLTALHYAVLVNSTQCVQHLVFRGSTIAHVSSADDKSQTPLMMAASNGYSDIINVLLSNDEIKKSINNTDPMGQSALHLACDIGAEDCINNLINQGANPNLLDKANRTPLMSICNNGNAICVGPLIEGGADIVQDDHSCIHVAVRNGHTAVVEQLIAFGVGVEILDGTGNTPLQLAVTLNSEEMVQLLLDRGANPNSLSMDGLTGVHYAAREGNVHVLKLLLEKQGYVNEMDKTINRYTPLDYAEQNDHLECMNLLLQYGGVTIDTIKNIAAICIQNAYRGHRAKQHLNALRKEAMAASILQRHVRGFLTRIWYLRTMKETRAAIKIQAHIRGFIQRRKFSRMLEIHRLDENQRDVIETFAKFIQTLRDNSSIMPISIQVTERTEDTDMKKRKADEQTRKERSLTMRELYLEKQRNWELFRQAENQRRIDKAHQEKMDYLNGVLQGKYERRQYFIEQFRYTTSVRSHCHAAIIIQRCYRKYKWRRDGWRKMAEARHIRERAKECFAASVIQNAWKKYKEWKKFEKTYMCPIYTSPIVRINERPLPEINGKGLKSYERSTLTSGIGRRKLHQTQSGGFKIFKPIPIIPPSTLYTKHTSLKQHAILNRKWTRDNRINRMRVHWPWVEKMGNNEEKGSDRDRLSSPNKTGIKLPHIN